MLTVEMLKQSPALTGLTDEQLGAVVEMSKNDEGAVIGARIGALHGQYDADIFSITGLKKRDGEKSYDYAKRVLAGYKSKADASAAIQAELDAAKANVAELQAKLEKGANDAELRQQLKDAKAQVEQLQSSLKAKETEFGAKAAEYETAIKNTHVDYAFQSAVSGLKFKSGITEAVQKVLLNSAKAEVLSKGEPDFIDDGQGGKKLVLRGTDGNILNNPKNNLNPYTLQELVMETSLKDVVDTGRKLSGGGTGAFSLNQGPGGNSGTLDLSEAKNQIEADMAIEKHLLASGLTRDSQEFARQSLQLRNENGVANLPIK